MAEHEDCEFVIVSPPLRRQTRYKCILVGEPNAGKTSLAQRIAHDHFDSSNRATIGPSSVLRKVRLSSGQVVALDIWDTAGQERFHSLSHSYYRSVKAAVIVYDSDSRPRTGDQLKDVVFNLGHGQKNLEAKIFLVGTKIDLGMDFAFTDIELESLGKKEGVVIEGHFLLSSKTGENVEDTVKALAEVLERENDQRRFEQSIKSETIRISGEITQTGKQSNNGCNC